jgi:hypothetical protein
VKSSGLIEWQDHAGYARKPVQKSEYPGSCEPHIMVMTSAPDGPAPRKSDHDTVDV